MTVIKDVIDAQKEGKELTIVDEFTSDWFGLDEFDNPEGENGLVWVRKEHVDIIDGLVMAVDLTK